VFAAAGVAELIGGRDVKDVLVCSKDTFYYVSAASLTREDMSESRPNPELQRLAQRALLGHVDAFVSHSWSDNADAKWMQLQRWRAAFKHKHNREPTLWIDKYCINQRAIDASLACLPVYLSGCTTLLVLLGETYLQRLWCVIEIFVFLQMGASTDNLEICRLQLASDQDETNSQLRAAIAAFDPSAAKCTCEIDTQRLQEVLLASGQGQEDIQQFVRQHFATCEVST